jgi:hypothetical protein
MNDFFVISESLREKIDWGRFFEVEFLDAICLRGERERIKLYGVAPKSSPGGGYT